MTMGAFLDFVYYLFTRNGDEQSVEKFRRTLWMPPKGVAPDPRSPWSPEAETAAFRAAKAMTTGQIAPSAAS